MRPDELATALTWRIRLLTDPPPYDPLSALPDPQAEPAPDEDEILPAPRDLTRIATTVDRDHLDQSDDWLANLNPFDDDPAPASAASGSADPDRQLSVVDKLDAVLAFDRYAPPARPDTDSTAAMLAADDEQHRWAAASIGRARLVELNAQAADYYAARYRHSWAPDYLASRLGTDLSDDFRFRPGYAPPGWTHLVEHLRRRGATDTELLAAGLASRSTRTGLIYDRFRDRLVFALRSAPGGGDEDPYGGTAIIGFIARRNPVHDDHHTDDRDCHPAGPKYLNTPTTTLYRKGAHLYGLAETADLLATGATPVLVEGPVDAIAVTLAGDGAYVGLAPLGTSLTSAHADQLRSCMGPGRPGIIVATDPDDAGQAAAARNYWLLAVCGDTPRHAVLRDNLDPAALRQTHGDPALRAALDNSTSLASALIHARLDRWAERFDTVEGRVHAARAAAPIIAALPPEQWAAQIALVAARVGTAGALLHLEVLDAAYIWTRDLRGAAARQLRALAAPTLAHGQQPAPDTDPPREPAAPATLVVRAAQKPLPAATAARRLTSGPPRSATPRR